MNSNPRTIIEKWYKTLFFPRQFDEGFYAALDSIEVKEDASIETYDLKCTDGKKNFLHFLYFCEACQNRYMALGLPEDILLATLEDLVIWSKIHSEIKGELYLGELAWLSFHLQAKLFRLGRLQFCAGTANHDIPQAGMKQGDPVLDMHIPAVGPLLPEDVDDALQRAREFYAKYFPQTEYRFFTCHSWLLDEALKPYLPETSNILRFGNRFIRGFQRDSYALLGYIFRWDTKKDNVADAVCTSRFAEAIKQAVLNGETFHETLGTIPV